MPPPTPTGTVARIKPLSEVRKYAFEPTRAGIGTDFVDAVNFIGDFQHFQLA